VRSYVETVAGEGGTLITGGLGDGWMVRPTVITGFGQGARHSREEIFGPLVVVIRFDTEVEAIELVNDSPYGLNAMLFTENLHRAHRVSAALRVGMVWVNCFFIRAERGQRPDSRLDDLPNMILNRRHLLYAARDHG
jgi:aminomuconate-semialdehyde/2-hydroxymuconate-6-semialdehyde dehydrogenase